ncbi:MAG: DNA-3-methyladenine glycosylase I [Planctomycetota bacterium]
MSDSTLLLRCPWCGTDPDYVAYHDREWGVPERDDRALFELLCLEGAQAGLSWITILRKRDNYRRAFRDFDIAKVARFTDARIDRLMQDAGLVRLRSKLDAVVKNARACLTLGRERPLAEHLWSFVGGRPLQARRRTSGDVPACTTESDAMSKDLKKRGFKFVGSTICYAFMQASGMVNDHLTGCFRHRAVARLR